MRRPTNPTVQMLSVTFALCDKHRAEQLLERVVVLYSPGSRSVRVPEDKRAQNPVSTPYIPQRFNGVLVNSRGGHVAASAMQEDATVAEGQRESRPVMRYSNGSR